MNQHSLQAVLRSLADTMPAVEDRELLNRFVGGDEGAFAELVRRHGRLVWYVCRHLAGSDADADDAFQATFLVLLHNARKIRDAGKLSSWLHGVAYKVCARARRAAQRRANREQVVAKSERNGSVVSDSAWDRALTAVHEEVGILPETLRLPFVLCCLEGMAATEAAKQLGWKLGTLSGRLTRAKDALLARLNARGLTIGVVAGLGLANPPATAIAKATALSQFGFIVPSSVLQLSKGVIGMSMTSFKLLAAVMLIGGLGISAGSGWIASADAQPPAKPTAQKSDPQAEVMRLQAELERALLVAQDAKLLQDRQLQKSQSDSQALQQLLQAQLSGAVDSSLADALAMQLSNDEKRTANTSKWEYDFVKVSAMGQTKFVEFLHDRENRGWEFNGTTTLIQEDKPTATWVFRKPANALGTASSRMKSALATTSSPMMSAMASQQLKDDNKIATDRYAKAAQAAMGNEAKAIEDQIAKLQETLALLKAKETWSHNLRVVFMKDKLPVEPKELSPLLIGLADKKFAKGRCSISSSDNGIAVEGDKEVIDWVTALVNKLSEK
jgi:RNA polymerase sigma factor (sigma-70 family)